MFKENTWGTKKEYVKIKTVSDQKKFKTVKFDVFSWTWNLWGLFCYIETSSGFV